jgi:hypothetical protein
MSWGIVTCPRILTLAGLGTVAKAFIRFPPFSNNKNKSDYWKMSMILAYINATNPGKSRHSFAKAGTQEETGFRVKPGMTNSSRFMSFKSVYGKTPSLGLRCDAR